MMRIVDRYGQEQDWAWLEAHYGPLVIHPATPGPGWRVVEIWENADPVEGERADRPAAEDHFGVEAASVIVVKLLDADGQPQEGVKVAWYWPDAPPNGDAGPSNGLPEGMIPGRCDRPVATNAEGVAGFGMGGGAYYYLPNIGPHATWVYGKLTNSDVVFGLGMMGGTNHHSLWPVFRWDEGEEPPPPPPPPPPPGDCPVKEILQRVCMVERQCKEIRALLPNPIGPND